MMSQLSVRRWAAPGVFAVLSLLSGCFGLADRPEAQRPPTAPARVPTADELRHDAEGAAAVPARHAVWISLYNGVSGQLARFDLDTGQFNARVRLTGSDTFLLNADPATGQSMFLLTRISKDAVAIIDSADGKIAHRRALTEGINPQSATRDAEGRVWLANLDSNQLSVFSPDLGAEVASVDLSALVEPDSDDGLAELAHLRLLGDGRILAIAQNLDRRHGWRPRAESSAAWIDPARLDASASGGAVVHTDRIQATNPIAVSERGNFLASAGDLSGTLELFGSLLSLGGEGELIERSDLGARVLDAFWEGDRALDHGAHHVSQYVSQYVSTIRWNPELSQSCLFLGEQRLVCEGDPANRGYTFGRILHAGRTVFATYTANQNSELWIVTQDEDPSRPARVQKIALPMSASSLSFGP